MCLRRIPFTAKITVSHGRAVLGVFQTFRHSAIGSGTARFQTGSGRSSQAQHIAPVLRQLIDPCGIELRTDCAAVISGKLNFIARDGYLFRHVTHGKLGVDLCILGVLQCQGSLVLLHAGCAEGKRIVTGEQTGDGVKALTVRCCIVGDAGALVHHMNRAGRQGSARGILRDALDQPGTALRRYLGRKKQGEQYDGDCPEETGVRFEVHLANW